MVIRTSLLILAATGGAGGLPPAPAIAQTTVAQPAVLQTAPAAKKERKICRTTDRIGSRVSAVRTCHTKAEWDDMEAETRSSIRDFQEHRSGNPTNGG